jgi:hypothetical protein
MMMTMMMVTKNERKKERKKGKKKGKKGFDKWDCVFFFEDRTDDLRKSMSGAAATTSTTNHGIESNRIIDDDQQGEISTPASSGIGVCPVVGRVVINGQDLGYISEADIRAGVEAATEDGLADSVSIGT